jgi:hypothetical protein
MRWTVDKGSIESAFAGVLDEDNEYYSVLPYSRGKVPHLRHEAIFQPAVGDDKVNVSLRYDATGKWPSGPVPKGLQRSAEFLERLLTIQSVGPVRCQAEFRYSVSSNIDTVIPLPFDFGAPGDPSQPIDEIRGIRGVKHPDGSAQRPGYNFILERSGDEGIRLWLGFELPAGPVELTPEKALSIANDVAGKLVLKKKGSRREQS